MELERHVPLYFEAALIQGLPLNLKVSTDCAVSLDYATENDISAIHALLRDCAKRGDNVGTREFLDFDKWEEKIATISWIFSIRDPDSNKLEGGLILTPMQQGRSLTPGNVGVYLYLTENLREEGGFSTLMQTAEQFANELKLRYFACVYSVFICHDVQIQVLRDLGYSITAAIPLAGEVKGQRGLLESLIMVKVIGPRIQPFSRQQLIEMVEGHGFLHDAAYFQNEQLPRVKGLPQEYYSRRGIRMNIRNAEKADHQWMFEIIFGAADSSDGYSIDSYPTLEIFRETTLGNAYSIILELADTKQRMGYLILSTAATYSRDDRPIMCDCNLIVDPSFKGIGIGNEIYDLWFSIGKELGYTAVISDAVITNTRLMSLQRFRGFVVVGTLPKSCFMKNIGWTDTYIIYRNIVDEKPFTQLWQERKKGIEAGDHKAQTNISQIQNQ